MPNHTVNEDLRDDSISHQIRNVRLQAHDANENEKYVKDEIIPEVDSVIEKNLIKVKARGPDTTENKNVQKVIKEANKAIKAGFTRLNKIAIKELVEISQTETAFQSKMIGRNLPIRIDFSTIPKSKSKDIANNFVFDGRTTKEWYSSVASSASRNIEQQIKQGIANGETTEEILNRLRGQRGVTSGQYQKIRNNIKTISRTVTNGVQSETRRETYKDNRDIIDRVQWLATLDSRTTVICASLDGETFPVDRGPRPPAHLNCRSTTVPVIKSFEELNLPGSKNIPKSTRASIDGQVASTVTYPQWLKDQPIKIQEEVLGVEGAKLFRQGKVKISSFVSDDLKPLSLQEVKKREGIK